MRDLYGACKDLQRKDRERGPFLQAGIRVCALGDVRPPATGNQLLLFLQRGQQGAAQRIEKHIVAGMFIQTILAEFLQ
jgi:hypothetical protein